MLRHFWIKSNKSFDLSINHNSEPIQYIYTQLKFIQKNVCNDDTIC